MEECVIENLTCSICDEIYSKPKTLHCLHSFCAQCLQNYIDNEKERKTHYCPLCREEFKIANNDVSRLKTNFCYQNIINIIKITPETHVKQPCSFCASEKVKVNSKFKCLSCGDFLCASCAKMHPKMSQNIGHNVVKLTDMRSGKYMKEMRSGQNVPCSEHRNEYLQLFCDTCNVPVCLKCIVSLHDKHTFLHPSDARKKRHQEIQLLTKQLSGKLKTFQSQSENVSLRIEELNSIESSMKSEIKAFGREVVKNVNSICQAAEEYLQNVTKPKYEALQSIQDEIIKEHKALEQSIVFCEQVLKDGSDFEVLSLQSAMTKRLEELSVCGTATSVTFPKLKMPVLVFHQPNIDINFKKEHETSQPFVEEGLCDETYKGRVYQREPVQKEEKVGKCIAEGPLGFCNQNDNEDTNVVSYGKLGKTVTRMKKSTSLQNIGNSFEKSHSSVNLNVEIKDDKFNPKYTGIAWINDDNFVIADGSNNKLKMSSISIKSVNSITVNNIVNVTSCKFGIASRSHGNLKIFDHNLKKVKEFQNVVTLMTTYPSSKLLCWFNGRKVFILKSLESTPIEKIPSNQESKVIRFEEAKFMCCLPNEQIVVSDWSEHCICLFDKDCKLIQKLNYYPGSICADAKSNFYVADYFESTVNVFSSHGTFQRQISLKHILHHPRAITIFQGKMLVACVEEITLMSGIY